MIERKKKLVSQGSNLTNHVFSSNARYGMNLRIGAFKTWCVTWDVQMNHFSKQLETVKHGF